MKCFCQKDPTTTCGDCGTLAFTASGDEIEDIQSALSFFIESYKGAPQTKKAMSRILKRTWKAVRARKDKSDK